MVSSPVVKIHRSSVGHFDFIEKILFEELQRQNRIEIIEDEPATVKEGAL